MNEDHRKLLLNAGCGGPGAGRLPACFTAERWREIRLDIDPANRPDVVANFADMRGAVPDDAVDAIYSSHAIEHLPAHEVIPAFREFRRVLRPEGFVLATCPDLTAIAQFLLDQGAEAVAYDSPAGPIRPIDMLYGHGLSISRGSGAMAHKTGFTAKRLARIALEVGFAEARVMEGRVFDLWAVLLGPKANPAQIAPLFRGLDLARLFDASAVAGGPLTAPGHAPY